MSKEDKCGICKAKAYRFGFFLIYLIFVIIGCFFAVINTPEVKGIIVMLALVNIFLILIWYEK